MPATRAVYSVIQYVPDPSRAEAANTGVVLYVPSERRIVVRTSPALARVKKFFAPGRHDTRRVESAIEAIRHRMEIAEGEFDDEADLARFAAARADAVRLTPPRLVMVGDAPADLDALYEELVGDAGPEARLADSGRTLPRGLAEVFGRLQAVGKVWRPGQITVPTAGRRFKVAAAYQNGRTNYVRPESLARGKAEDRLPQLGFNGQLIAKHPIDGRPGRLIVVSSEPAAEPGIETRFRDALSEFEVRFVPHAEVDEFAAEVEQTAH